ncbi:BQ5605_C002g01815 [Microbotryum silenes-dioicae]|uniref:BQ5605_C002g01815 protein n=1 Tax=Microbotryum silenes-dioicae TaxID=796604 RepID=A0A2X0MLT2_9BASI|nr:BQ5605_C002g01815 [Microbotryum silenes-dioicae]
MCTPGSTQPLQGPWPMDQYPCSLDYINYHVNGVGMRAVGRVWTHFGVLLEQNNYSNTNPHRPPPPLATFPNLNLQMSAPMRTNFLFST